ncbi:MAG: UDP-N-acetylmuramoyl-tripeptide--D-alanyl-D-alanine ligase [Bacilli bacterium]|nr:UDP-N-acetylmuramoyl-tripeptide--D-alanyl-D-alanine ligase [Bacilli bacterium]
MVIVYLLLILSFILINFYKTKRSLHMLQQNLYNENNRYLKWVMKNKKQFIDIDLLVVIITLIVTLFVYNNEFMVVLLSIIMALLNVLMAIRWRRNIKNDQNKKKLVVTARIKRLICTILILFAIPLVFMVLHSYYTKNIWNMFLVLSLMTYLNNFVVFIAMLINTPIEKCVYLHFKTMAQSKLRSMPNLKIIGITGSYGKTSSKRILADILNVKYNALPTPRNLNTYNGLIMTVNNYMDKFTDIFIAEMGAYVKGEIAGLCRLVKPKYGILTTIGTAHLESFGSQENIQKGKFELIESLPSDGFGILNADDPLQVSYKLKNNVRIIWIGIENKDVDVYASNIKCSNKGTSFDVTFKGDKKKYHFQTKLLGKHNVYNILSAIACGKEFGIDTDDLIEAVSGVRPVEHRLELKHLGNFYMIDDAYNSNPVGAKRALEVLGMMPGIKVVVTPGMIELGEKEDEYNKVLGEQISEVADYVILIGEKKTKPINDGLLEKGFDKDKIIVFNDVREAYPFITTLTGKEEVYALFENDLPDTYNEK